MPSPFYIRLAALLVSAMLCVAAILAWRADRRDRAQLAAELASTKQLLAAADARQHDRDAQLAQTLAALAAEKRAIVTPAQILRALPETIPLPAPITLQPGQAASVGARFSLPRGTMGASQAPPSREAIVGATPGSPATNANNTPVGEVSLAPTKGSTATTTQPNQKTGPAGALIPTEDLKPLYDFSLDCQACQAKLSAAQANLADEKAKTVALAKERDDALRIARGGSAWRRLARAAKWFVLGAAAGAVAAKAR